MRAIPPAFRTMHAIARVIVLVTVLASVIALVTVPVTPLVFQEASARLGRLALLGVPPSTTERILLLLVLT